MNMFMRKKRSSFTLLELVVVIIIIALIGVTMAGIIIAIVDVFMYVANYLRAVTIANDILDIIIEGDENVPGVRFATKIARFYFHMRTPSAWYPNFGETTSAGFYEGPSMAGNCFLCPSDSDGIMYIVGWPAKNDMRVVDVRVQALDASGVPTTLASADTPINRCRILRRITGYGIDASALWYNNPNSWSGGADAYEEYEVIPYYYSPVEFSIENPSLARSDGTYSFFKDIVYGGGRYDFDNELSDGTRVPSVISWRPSSSLAMRIRVRVGNASYSTARRVPVCYSGPPAVSADVARFDR